MKLPRPDPNAPNRRVRFHRGQPGQPPNRRDLIVSVKLNNVPVEGYKSAEFSCTYNAGLVEKSNIVPTDLFGADPVSAVHDPQIGPFIVAIAGTHSNRATTSGPAFTFSARGLQAGAVRDPMYGARLER